MTCSYKGRQQVTRLVREAPWVLQLLEESDPCRQPKVSYGLGSLLTVLSLAICSTLNNRGSESSSLIKLLFINHSLVASGVFGVWGIGVDGLA